MEFKFNVATFFIGIAIGMLYLYFVETEKKKEIVFPTPFNSEKVTYHDEANNCFQFVATKVKCPTDKTKIKEQPIFS